MHTINDITGRGRYLIETATCLISVEVLLHPTGGYSAYTDISRSVPLCALGDVAARLLEIERRLNWLNARQARSANGSDAAESGDVTGTAV
jgi:hypothetical protein